MDNINIKYYRFQLTLDLAWNICITDYQSDKKYPYMAHTYTQTNVILGDNKYSSNLVG